MKWIKGDFFKVAMAEGRNTIAFTANAVVKPYKGVQRLVMGAGAAKAVRDTIPDIDKQLADVLEQRASHHGYDYKEGIQPDFHIIGVKATPFNIIAVQVKRDYKGDGDFDLTKVSLEKLRDQLQAKPDVKAVMNCPLVGHGGFDSPAATKQVMEMVEEVFGDLDIIVTTL